MMSLAYFAEWYIDMSFSEGQAPPENTSPSLIDSARRQDPLAWRRLVQLYGPLVYRWCRHSGLQEADAADVAQAVFRNVSQALGRFSLQGEQRSFRGWLRVITSNRIRDWARADKKLPRAIGGSTAHAEFQQIVEGNSSSDEPLQDHPAHDRLHAALAQLRSEMEDRTWAAFWRTTVESRPAGEVAVELGMKRQAVFQAKSRTLKRLRTLLETTPQP